MNLFFLPLQLLYYSSLQKTLDDLQKYQRTQEKWIETQEKIRAEQAPRGVMLEQRLLYREHKIRETIEFTPPNSSSDRGSGSSSKSPKSGNSRPHSNVVNGDSSCQAFDGSDTDCNRIPLIIPLEMRDPPS